jgi:hypothetical protein
MNELYAVLAFFVLIGLLVSRMKREQGSEAAGESPSNPQGFTSAETMQALRETFQSSRSSSSTTAAKGLSASAE